MDPVMIIRALFRPCKPETNNVSLPSDSGPSDNG
jgi:hypothetical protein